MLRRQLHRRRTVNGIHPGSKNGDRCTCGPGRAIEFEVHERAFTATNPVALHGPNFFRPAVEFVEAAQ